MAELEEMPDEPGTVEEVEEEKKFAVGTDLHEGVGCPAYQAYGEEYGQLAGDSFPMVYDDVAGDMFPELQSQALLLSEEDAREAWRRAHDEADNKDEKKFAEKVADKLGWKL